MSIHHVYLSVNTAKTINRLPVFFTLKFCSSHFRIASTVVIGCTGSNFTCKIVVAIVFCLDMRT